MIFGSFQFYIIDSIQHNNDMLYLCPCAYVSVCVDVFCSRFQVSGLLVRHHVRKHRTGHHLVSGELVNRPSVYTEELSVVVKKEIIDVSWDRECCTAT